MGIMQGINNWLEGAFCQRIALQGQESAAQAQQLQRENETLTIQLETANTANQACSASTDAQKQALIAQAGQIQQLQAKNADLTAQAANTGKQLWLKPCPALLQEVQASKVMLGQVVMRTNQGTLYLDYPTHPSIYTPGPIYEGTLNASDTNRQRPDIPIQTTCIKIANVEQHIMTYLTDQAQYGTPDCWMNGVVAKLIGKDDCETLATNINNALFYRELKHGIFPNHSTFLALGHLKQGGQTFGHGFVVIMHNTSLDLNDSYLIEATLNFEAEPMTLQEAKNSYDMDWGFIGWTRDAHPEGTYLMRDDMAWWNATARVTDAEREGWLQEFIHRIKLEPTKNDEKREAIRKIWESRRII